MVRGRVPWVSVVAVLCAPGLVAARPDVIFHVPEVLVRHAAVPRPVGTGRAGTNATRHANDSDPWITEDGLVQERYEYYVEHEISTLDAKKAALLLRLTDTLAPIGCGTCSRRDLEYCETKVVADHCCCERSYLREPFPWLPHTCYIGPERCEPLAGNCELYTRLRDCCCTHKLATRWKGILSKGSRLGAGGATLLLLGVALFAAVL